MWHTSEGTRTLVGDEARLIRETAWELVDAIRSEIHYDGNVQFGIVPFDQLTWQQQMSMVLKVLRSLTYASVEPAKPSALMDATAAAIYAQMRVGVEIEIEMQQTASWSEERDTERRQEIIAAIREHNAPGNWPDPECVVMSEWELAIDEVGGWVLGDEDYQMDRMMLDLPPEESYALKVTMGIGDDYFTDIAPDVSDREARVAWADIIELVTGRRPDEAVC